MCILYRSVYIQQNGFTNAFNTPQSWTILNPIEKSIRKKIESVGTPLIDWNISINYGIKTGCNEAFIIDEQKKNELIAEDPKSAEIIRPILRGRDIGRYSYNFANLYLINSHNGIKEKNIPPVDISEYPAIKAHLDKFYAKLVKREDKGETPYNLRNCAYMDDFSKQKIMYPNMTKYMPFLYDTNGFMLNDKGFIITGKHIAYLSAFFNSSLFKYCFRDNFPSLADGRELRKVFFDKIPVIQISDKQNAIFEEKVNQVQTLVLNKKESKYLEIELDNMIFDIYNLSSEDRKTIGFFEIT